MSKGKLRRKKKSCKTRRPNQGRRQFLQASGALFGWVSLAGCQTIDRWALKEDQDDPKRVVILGAGAAGLAAAMTLKKANVPFRLFEASSRVGGRVFTLRDFNASYQNVELGASWFSPEHEFVRDFAKELKIDLLEIEEVKRTPHFLIQGNFLRDFREGQERIAYFANQYAPQELDRLAFSVLLERLRDSGFYSYALSALRKEWGAEPSTLSALAAIRLLQAQRKDPFGLWTQRSLRIKGGSHTLMQAMYDRVVGIIPNQLVRMEHRLVGMGHQGGELILDFDTPEGSRRVRAAKVICTLPFSTLREVKGINEISIGEARKRWIENLGYGSHAKLALSFSDRFWQSSKMEQWVGNLRVQEISVEAPFGSGRSSTPRGILVANPSGTEGVQAGLHSIGHFLKDLEGLFKVKDLFYEKISHVQNWSQLPFSKGSVSYPKPGQYLAMAELASPAELDGRLQFAGEHISLRFPGTLNGALQTGLLAAREFIRQK